ncbi:MAG: DUF5615 family PIN-like protein [Nitrospinae bacterium]|nr:DUF5615 family PIN-like protein [Nitrospinota bacterium]
MSCSKFKFLLDENVRIELYKFLKAKGVDAVFASKGLSDEKLAKLSLKEERILVTNDGDFAEYSAGKVFAVVWLKISQNDANGLIRSFSLLIKLESSKLKDKLVILRPDKVESSSLGEE